MNGILMLALLTSAWAEDKACEESTGFVYVLDDGQCYVTSDKRFEVVQGKPDGQGVTCDCPALWRGKRNDDVVNDVKEKVSSLVGGDFAEFDGEFSLRAWSDDEILNRNIDEDKLRSFIPIDGESNEQWQTEVVQGVPVIAVSEAIRHEQHLAGTKRWEEMIAAFVLEQRSSAIDSVFARRGRRVQLSLESMPPSRLTCEVISRSDDSLHAEGTVVFDPILGSSMLQQVTLADTSVDGLSAIEIRCWGRELLRDVGEQTETKENTKEKMNVAWWHDADECKFGVVDGKIEDVSKEKRTEKGEDDDSVPSGTDESIGRGVEVFASKGVATCPLRSPLHSTWHPKLHIDIEEVDPNISEQRRTLRLTKTDTLGERGLLDQAAPELVVDTFTILAEIAETRAKKQAVDALGAELEFILCSLGTWERLEAELEKQPVTIPVGAKGPLLPNTCTAVRETPVEELIESGKQLAVAIETDLIGLGFIGVGHLGDQILDGSAEACMWDEHASPMLDELAIVLKAAVKDGGYGTEQTGQLIGAAAHHEWSKTCSAAPFDDEQQAGLCAVEVGLAVASACTEAGGCDAVEIRAMLNKPHDFFSLDESACQELVSRGDVAEAYEDLLPQVTAVTHRLVTVTMASTTLSERERSALIVEAFGGLVPIVLGSDSHSAMIPLVQETTAAVAAAVRGDEASALAASLRVLDETLTVVAGDDGTVGVMRIQQATRRAVPWVITLASHSEQLRAELETEEDIEAARQARKQAIEGLIDASTSRRGRHGEWVSSLGANVGVGGVCGFGESVTCGESFSIPMGFQLQKLPDARKTRNGVGFQSQLTVIDGAQLLEYLPTESKTSTTSTGTGTTTTGTGTTTTGTGTTATGTGTTPTTVAADDSLVENPVLWGDFTHIGVGVGLLVGRPVAPFSVTADWRYRPVTEEHYLGLRFGVPIAFFDFH